MYNHERMSRKWQQSNGSSFPPRKPMHDRVVPGRISIADIFLDGPFRIPLSNLCGTRTEGELET